MSLNDLLLLLLIMLAFLALGILFWGIGRYLRKKGHGPRLDQLDAKVTSFKASTSRRLIGPLGSFLFNTLQSFGKFPLLGSKHLKTLRDKQEKTTETTGQK